MVSKIFSTSDKLVTLSCVPHRPEWHISTGANQSSHSGEGTAGGRRQIRLLLCASSSPVSSCQFGRKGPEPRTRVQYALVIPMTSLMVEGATPNPYIPGGDGIGRSNIGVSSKVDVKHRALCTFGQNPLAVGQSLVDEILTIYVIQGTEQLEAVHPFCSSPAKSNSTAGYCPSNSDAFA